MTTIATDLVTTRPKVCEFFAGRVWYAGVQSTSKSGWVLFSQVASTPDKLNRCYQENDPTSEIMSDILDTDGGVIPIPESGEIVSLQSVGNVLVVLATQGVWSIRGGDNGFKATEYSVEKLSSVGCITTKSVVKAEEVVFFWSAQGIYALKVDQTGVGQAQNISDPTIKTYYASIPLVCKLHVSSVYNETEKVLYWTFSDSSENLTTYGKSYKNTVLKLDARLNAFYTENVTTGVPAIRAVAVTKETLEEEQTFGVVSAANNVLVVTDEVVAPIAVVASAAKQTKFFYSTASNYYIADYKTSRLNFLDFGVNEEDAFLVTGWNMGGVGPARQKTALYLTVFAKRTEEVVDVDYDPVKPSSILMQTRWNFTDSSFTNKWSDEYEVYRQLRPYFLSSPGAIEDGYPLVITKNKIRGRGKALQIKWKAGVAKDMKLVGWTTTFIGNTGV